MGLTQKLGTIPLAILTDTSNNVGIGGSPSGSYKLEVTGTAKVSSTLLVSGAATLSGTETTLNFNPQTNLLSGYYYLNFGGGSIMYRNTTDIYIGSNSKYGSAGTTVANYTSANGMGMLTMDGGTLNYQSNATSVTAGTVYSMPIRFTINGSGNIGIGGITPSGLLSLKAEPTNTPTLVFQNSLGGPNSAISNYTSAVQTFTCIGTNLYINSAAGLSRFNTSYESSGITFDEGTLRLNTGTTSATASPRITINNVGTSTFSGQINSSMGNDQLFFNATSATTGYQYMNISNTSGGLLIGVEGSTAANLQSGDIAYSSVITTRNASNLSLGTNQVERLRIAAGGAITIPGSLSKGSGSFRIDHPLEYMTETHQLVHSFIEGPKADLIYRGKLNLINGKAQANIDKVSTMTDGTFEVLCREVQCFTTNESGWDLVKGKVIGNIIYIESQNTNSTDEISWMVIGERKDKHMIDTSWTDENGKVIVEPLKPIGIKP